MATIVDLERCVSDAIQEERRRVKKMRKAHPKRKHRITDYAAMVIACGYARSGETFSGKSETPINYPYVDSIRERLEALAPIGEKRAGCDNTVGACAEPHAADKVIKAFPGCHLDELQFSAPYRPRTAKRKRCCINCKDTFLEVL